MGTGSLDASALLERARRENRFYSMKSGWRRAQYFAGFLCCLLVLGIPLGIWIFVRASKAGVGITQEGFAFRYLTTLSAEWDEVESITASGMSGVAFGGGLVGAATAAAVKAKTKGLKGPLNFKLRGKRMPKAIPAHTIENSLEMAMEMERLSGIEFLPKSQED